MHISLSLSLSPSLSVSLKICFNFSLFIQVSINIWLAGAVGEIDWDGLGKLIEMDWAALCNMFNRAHKCFVCVYELRYFIWFLLLFHIFCYDIYTFRCDYCTIKKISHQRYLRFKSAPTKIPCFLATGPTWKQVTCWLSRLQVFSLYPLALSYLFFYIALKKFFFKKLRHEWRHLSIKIIC